MPPNDDLSQGEALRLLISKFDAANERLVTEMHASNAGFRASLSEVVVSLKAEIAEDRLVNRSERQADRKVVAAGFHELRQQAPGRFALYCFGAVVIFGLAAQFALIASKGMDPGIIADAVQTVTIPVP